MIIAVANQKGGVGKTTTVVNLADWFRSRGRLTLVVDFDVQGHAATSLGMKKSDALFRLLVNQEKLDQVAMQARPGLDLIASNKMTEKVKTYLTDVPFRELAIAQALEEAASAYEVVLLDLAPGSDLLHVGALIASDYFLIPAKLDFLALDGVIEVLKTARALAKVPNVEPPQLLGILPTMYDRTTNETVDNLKRLAETVGNELILPPIPVDTHAREATSRGLTIWEYSPDTAAAIGYPGHGTAAKNSRGNLGGYLHLGEIIEEMVR
jgi:chromosome partitioning protein